MRSEEVRQRMLTLSPKSPMFGAPSPRTPGCDLSHFNMPPQWGQSNFAFIKAMQGLYPDPAFLHLAGEAKMRGILRNAYYFMAPGDPVAHAQAFVQLAKENQDFGYSLDWETHPELVTEAVAFKNEVQRLTGQPMTLYSDLGFLEQLGPHVLQQFSECMLWLADLSHGGPHLPAGVQPSQLRFWQYKFGDKTEPDQDVFFGSLTDLRLLVK